MSGRHDNIMFNCLFDCELVNLWAEERFKVDHSPVLFSKSSDLLKESGKIMVKSYETSGPLLLELIPISVA